ncbi:hypothetical protein CK228_18210 [Mesorhizobium sp. WSM4312]|nr:hypothetical protein CK232_24170 [Mesorhizobium sp. WSM4304]PBB67123.1 hypothetical protein CK228_18210 [Mesorhizobium sp. WSM4312]PBB72964.1 hypothetical protein CK227_22875 [Mesorhizobium sp. WSM4308]PBC20857.1 hypothetical protein CK226_22235 [Mesorhizobium sp. WSM4311]
MQADAQRFKGGHCMQQIDDTKKPVEFDERERQSLIRIKETQELIERNRRLIERSREILSRANKRA